MQKNTLPWLIALTAWIAGSTYWHVCKIKEVCDEPLTKSVSSANTLAKPSFDIHNSDGLSLRALGNVKFPQSGETPNVSEVQPQLEQLKDYLSKNSSLQMLLIGRYASDEKNNTAFVNLGIARAEALKGILLGEKGNPQSIITDGVLSDSLYFQADTLIGGIDVIFKRVAPQSETSSNVDSSPDLTLYFPYAKTDFSHSEEIDKKIDNAITYLKAHPNQQVTLTGYTDNKGSDELNLKLSARRAQNVQDFFVRRGLSPEQFKIVSQGKANPQGNNDTQKGRQENRRVVLSF